MARFQDRLDTEAFDRLVSRFLSPALAVARQMLCDHSLAEDAVQEAFLRIVRHRARYRRSQPFSSCFYAIVRNVCVDMLRRRARQMAAIEGLGAEMASATTAAVPDAQAPFDPWQLLGDLPRGERDVLTLRIVHELPFRDVAAALGISEEAAKKRAQRGLRRLRRRAAISTASPDRPAPPHA